MRGSARMARAMETRWRWPPESLTPRSPTMVSYFFSKILGEFVHARDAAGFQDLFFGGVGAREGDVFSNGAVEQEGVLQDHAELRAVAIQADGGEVHAIDENLSFGGDVEGGNQADDGGFAGARRSHQRGDGAGLGSEADVAQHRLAGFVGEADVFENHFAADRAERHGAARSSSSGRSFRTSWVRSRPASASVIWVPMPTI